VPLTRTPAYSSASPEQQVLLSQCPKAPHGSPFEHGVYIHRLCSTSRRHWASSRRVMQCLWACRGIPPPKHIKFNMLALTSCAEHVQHQPQSQVAQCPRLRLQHRNMDVSYMCFCPSSPPSHLRCVTVMSTAKEKAAERHELFSLSTTTQWAASL